MLLQLGTLVPFDGAVKIGLLDELCASDQLMDRAEAQVCPRGKGLVGF